MMYELPTALDVGGVRHEIRSDWRAVLDIIAALSDPELTQADKLCCLLDIFYVNRPADVAEAVRQCFWFINMGQGEQKSSGMKLMDWEQDLQYIIAPINQQAGCEIRALDYMHWWTFMGYYYNIGDCMFAQIVAIRKKLKKGQKLEKYEKEFYRANREIVDIKTKYTEAEDAFINQLLGGGSDG